MNSTFRIEPIVHTASPRAEQLHALHMRAYTQEAHLLGALYFPPLERTVDDVRNSEEAFVGAFMDDALVGAASVWPDEDGMGMNIASLVVDPQSQRQGIGRRLLAAVLAAHGHGELTVQTGAKNLPALALYAEAGFVEFRRWYVGREPLELVKLRRPARLPTRTDMTVHLAADSYRKIEGERRPTLEDEQQLAALLLEAYRGTVDEEEKTLEQAVAEIRRTFAGEYGTFLPQCSRVIERNGQIVSAILVTAWQDRPLVAFAMTAPQYQRQGLARASLHNTMQDVLRSGESLLSLVVTLKNDAAYNLYQSLGFVNGR